METRELSSKMFKDQIISHLNKPRTLEQLSAKIQHEIAKIYPAVQKSYKNFEKRLDDCIACERGQLAIIVFGK